MQILYTAASEIDLPFPIHNQWEARAQAMLLAATMIAVAPTTFVSRRERWTGWEVQGDRLVTGDRCGKGVSYDVLPKGEQRRAHLRCSATEAS